MQATKRMSLTRYLLLAVICIGGLVSILATNGNGCLGVNEACEENSACCSNHCEGGRCCKGVPAALGSSDPASDCCSGQIRVGDHGPYCCGTEGMMVDDAEDCCEGLERVYATGRCAVPCPPGCTRTRPSVVGDAGGCECDDEVPPTPVEIPPCQPCTDLSDDNCYFYRVSHEQYWDDVLGTGCRLYGPFTAPDDETAEWCARNFAGAEGFSGSWPWLVEDLTEAPGKECNVR